MKEHFADILALNDMIGVAVLDASGHIVYQAFSPPPAKALTELVMTGLLQHLNGVEEAEFLFDNIRLVARCTPSFILVLVMGRYAPMAMVRLNSDILIPILTKTVGKGKGLSRLFKR